MRIPLPHTASLLVCLSVAIVCLPVQSYSQNQPDMGLWTTFSLEKEFTKKLAAGFDQEFRLRENLTRLNLFYTNPYVTYRITKRIKAGLGYRVIEKYMYKQQNFSFRHRLMFDLSYKYKIKEFTLSYRARLQGEVKDYNTEELGKVPEYFWRNKLDVKYDFGKISPHIGCEVRYQIEDPRNPSSNYGFHRARTYAGLDYKINKTNSVGIMYLLQQEYDIDDPGTGYIVGLEYSVLLERKKKKDSGSDD